MTSLADDPKKPKNVYYEKFKELEHLFVDGTIPEELLEIDDPLQFNYLLVQFKKEFNDRTHSDYIKYMNLELPYVSKRDECGGVITSEDWNDFIIRLTKMWLWVWRKWTRIIKNWKRKGK